MRKPKYISPSALSCWEHSQEEYYLKYLATKSPPRFPQTQPMAVGSSFDAYVKSYLAKELGLGGDFEEMFTSQVDLAHRDLAREWGKICFSRYRECGALSDIMLELDGAEDVAFEFSVQKTVGSTIAGSVGEVVLLGKPDCYFKNASGIGVLLDWKVNGFLATRNTSPRKGYIKCRPARKTKDVASSWDIHKDAQALVYEGITIDGAGRMEDVDAQWATQLAVYGWLMGEPVGGDFVVGIDQLVGVDGAQRIATFRNRIGRDFQLDVLSRFQNLWEIIASGWIFRDLSEAMSLERQNELDTYHLGLDDPWLNKIIGR